MRLSLWDIICASSIIGIWPRFIEPNLLKLERLKVKGPCNLKIVFISDLHLSTNSRIIQKVNSLEPDYILFGGDFLCYSKLCGELKSFLCKFKAKKGAFAVLGNHDYEKPLGVNETTGDYDILKRKSLILTGLKSLFSPPKPTGKITVRARALKPHQGLVELLKETPFKLLHNSSFSDENIQITGVGEYTAGDMDVEVKESDKFHVVLCHNPDGFPSLLNTPCDLILGGHTHGGQISLPFIWNHFTLMENRQYRRGLNGKCYVSRGLGSTVKLRLGSIPEITLIEVEK